MSEKFTITVIASGPQGCGKTSFINHIAELIHDTDYRVVETRRNDDEHKSKFELEIK